MQIPNKRYTCRWCGFTSTNIDDFELDFKNNQGFWCGDCDGFTFFDEAKNKEHRMLLLLEQKASSPIECSVPKTSLKKHLSPLRYPGGKSRLIDFLSTKFSASKMDTFVEVFAGGASVGLSLLDAGLIKKLVLNDCDIGVNAFGRRSYITPLHSSTASVMKPQQRNPSRLPVKSLMLHRILFPLSTVLIPSCC